MTVRSAVAHDADALAALHVASWRAAYLDLLPAALIADRTLERRRRQWRALLEVVQQRTLVIEEGGKVVGFSNFGPARDDDLPASVAEVYAIYLHPEVWRRGFGRALWRETAKCLRGLDYREVAVWLLEGNERALGFYRSRGLEPDGWCRAELDVGWPLEQIRLRGPLEGPP